jgi:hypothetical protein
MGMWTARIALTTAMFQLRQTPTFDDFVQRLLLEGTARYSISLISLTSSTCESILYVVFFKFGGK